MDEPSKAEGQPPKSSGREPCALVIFGIFGDLTRRKLVPALYNLMVDDSLAEQTAVIGFGRHDVTVDQLRAGLHEATAEFSRRKPIDEQVWSRFAARIDFVRGGLDDAAAYGALKEKLASVDRERGTQGNRLFYLATPPEFFPVILRNLHEQGLLGDATAGTPFHRAIIEKPFGRDLVSARALNVLLGQYLDESQTFRIDHYLGKETVQNILVFRFGNSIFEPLWNRKYIDHVQITASESIGVEKRGKFYDANGVLRDIVQNHLLQVLALCALEAPNSFDANDVRDAKVQVLRSLRPIVGPGVAANVVRAQYRGYPQTEGVSPDSVTPTFAAMKVMIDNWRWQGVPFYLRAGKSLAERRTEVSVHFQEIPLCLFSREEACHMFAPSVLTLRIQPEEGISLHFMAKVPGERIAVESVAMNMSYAETFKKPLSEAYERLLLDCLRGDATLFARRDAVEQAWTFITPILDAWDGDKSAVPIYQPGSDGPKAADELLARDGRKWGGLHG